MAPKRPRADVAAAAAMSSASTDGGKRVKFAPAPSGNGKAASTMNEDEAHEEELAMGDTGGSGGARKNVVVSGYESDSSGDEAAAAPKPTAGADGEDDDDDMFGDSAEKGKAKKENSKKEKEFLEMADIEGQEFGRGDDDDGIHPVDNDEEDYYDEDDLANDDEAPRSKRSKEGMGYKLTSFNMKDELNEGRFQADGTYLANKRDPLARHDAWLEGMSKQAIKAARDAKERADEQARQRELDEARRTEGALAQERDDCLIGILSLIRPGETPARALARLGAKKKRQHKDEPRQYKRKAVEALTTSSNEMQVDDDDEGAVSNRHDDKGKQKEEVASVPPLDPVSRDIETLTKLTSTLLSTHGELEIYDESYEDIIKTLKSEGAVRRDWVPPRPSSVDDNDDESSATTARTSSNKRQGTLISRPSASSTTSASTAPAPVQGNDDRKFVYKWTVTPAGQPADQEHGPYSRAELENWVKAGFFGENGSRIKVKVVGGDWQSWVQI